MLTIRLARVGTKNRPSYRIIICEKGRDNFGKILENLGTYNSFTKDLKLNEEKMKSWISKGAQLSATLNNLFITKGIIKGEKQKSRRMNTEKIVKKRTDKEATDKKASEDAKAAQEAAAAKAKADEETIKAAAPVEAPIAAEPVVEAAVETKA
jgi:small subunit ribosomal protein S16